MLLYVAIHAVPNFSYRFCKIVIFHFPRSQLNTEKVISNILVTVGCKMAATSKKCNFSPYRRNKYIFTVDNMSIWVILIVIMHVSIELTMLQ